MTDSSLQKNSSQRQDIETTREEKFSIVRVETNFERLPLWSPKPTKATKFVSSKTLVLEPEALPSGQIIERKIEIVPSAKYGYLTVQTQEYWCALQKLWHESSEKETGRIEFSITQLLKLLEKSDNTKSRNSAKLAIAQLATNQLEFRYTLYDKKKDETLKEVKSFHLLTDYTLAERKSNESIHDKCSVTLHPLIVSNLRSGFFKPILLSVVSQIRSDIARILYRKLDFHFSYYSKYEISTERFFRENGIIGKEYKYKSARKRILEKATKELLEKPTSSGAIISSYEIVLTVDENDLKLIVLARQEKVNSQKTIPLISEPTNVIQLSKVTKRNTKKQSTPLTPEVQELLEYFDKIFHGKLTSHTPAIQKKATEIVTTYGLPFSKFFVKFALAKAKETKYKPATFNGIVKYLESAVEAREQEKRVREIHTQQIEDLKQEHKTLDHQKKYEPVYFDYVLSLLEMYSLRFPQELTEFFKAEHQEEERLKEEIATSPKNILFAKEKMLDFFYRKEQKALRFGEFFTHHTQILVPTFWEWDKEINSEPLA